MDRPLIRRTTLRERLRAQVESAYPQKILNGQVNLARQRLLDAVTDIPAHGLAKVRDVRRFLRAVERARPVTNNESELSVASLLAEWPMTLPDDALLKRVPQLEAKPVRPNWNIWIFIQITRYDTSTGTVTRSVAIGSSLLVSTGILSNTAEWEFTQMLNLPAADPPRTRTIDVTYWVRERDPVFGNSAPSGLAAANLVYNGPVTLGIKRFNQPSNVTFEEFDVAINNEAGVTGSYSVVAAESGAELRPIALARD
jgi:hypothetical protein